MFNPEDLKKKKFENEDQLQAFCVLMISQQFPKLRGKVWHTQNEQYIPKEASESIPAYKMRCQKIGNLNKAKGKLAGFPDLGLKLNGILYTIELKDEDGVVSPAQLELHIVFKNDCPQVPTIVCKEAYTVYMYCKWICDTNLKIDFNGYKPFMLNFSGV